VRAYKINLKLGDVNECQGSPGTSRGLRNVPSREHRQRVSTSLILYINQDIRILNEALYLLFSCGAQDVVRSIVVAGVPADHDAPAG
jgi:hypothetical protein